MRTLLSCLGLASAVAVLVLGYFMIEAVDYVMDLQFQYAEHEDLTVVLNEPAASAVLDKRGRPIHLRRRIASAGVKAMRRRRRKGLRWTLLESGSIQRLRNPRPKCRWTLSPPSNANPRENFRLNAKGVTRILARRQKSGRSGGSHKIDEPLTAD